MYKFTNGLVVFDKETKEQYLKAGYKLVEEKKETTDESDKIKFIDKRDSRTNSKDTKSE